MTETLDCPHCGHGHRVDDIETYQEITTYWGDGEPHDFSCAECGEDFVVVECVTRTWTPFKTSEDARE